MPDACQGCASTGARGHFSCSQRGGEGTRPRASSPGILLWTQRARVDLSEEGRLGQIPRSRARVPLTYFQELAQGEPLAARVPWAVRRRGRQLGAEEHRSRKCSLPLCLLP